MIERIKKWLNIISPSKASTCDHEWERVKLIRSYLDYSGFHVFVYECRCKKCGAVETMKFY